MYMKNKNGNQIILLVGKSGTGKTTVSNILHDKYGYQVVESYTTRPPRFDGETGHIFVTDDEYEQMKDDICAFTEFDGNKYWAANKQVDKSDLYIIDPAGVEYFYEKYNGNKNIICMELAASARIRFERMRNRGDSIIKALRRLYHDAKAFKNSNPEILLNANGSRPDYIADKINYIATTMQKLDIEIKNALKIVRNEGGEYDVY